MAAQLLATESEDHAETTSLLQRPRRRVQANTASSRLRSSARVLAIMIASLVVLQISDQLIESPVTRLMESISCYRYYQRSNPGKLLTSPDDAGPGAIYGTQEQWCKLPDIQGEVVRIRSWQFFFDGIPTLALTMPFAWLQNRYGRRPFAILGIMSLLFRDLWILLILWYWQHFTLEWTWASSFHALLAGGQPVVSALFFTMIADVTSELGRAAIFMRVAGITLLSALITPQLTAWLMSYNPWLPIFIGTCTGLIGLGILLVIPETLNFATQQAGQPLSQHEAPQSIADRQPSPSRRPTVGAFDPAQTLHASVRLIVRDAKEATSFLWRDLRIPALISIFLLNSLGISSLQLLIQYASTRYRLSIAQATALLALRCGITLVQLLLVIPVTSRLLMSRLGWTVKRRDLLVTRVSLTAVSIGWACIGLSPSVYLFVASLLLETIGAGALYSLRSLLSALVSPPQVALVYSIVSMVDTLGLMFGAPILAGCFTAGLQMGGAGIGLPFYVLGGLCLLFVMLLLCVRLRKDEDEPDA